MGKPHKATQPLGGTDPAGALSLVGKKIDNRYLVKKVVGEGGMGVVYLGVHEALEREVAIKVLRPEVSRDEKTVARFKREARAASAIGSPHICDVSDFGTLEDGSTYFVMEMLNGPSLAKAMKPGQPMETERLLKIGAQLCDALGTAHARGIVHRDLKPDNVHLVEQGNVKEFVKVLDFGIAKVQNAAETKLTQAGQVFGTPHYMSPEQCAGHEVDQRTDIYALGVMLYEMACGRVPFDADNLMGLLTKHVYEQPIPPRELPTPVDVPAAVEAVILKCLAKQPSSRYQQMSELKADLEALLAGQTPDAVVNDIDRSLPTIPDSAYRQSSPSVTAAPRLPPPGDEPEQERSYLLIGGVIGAVLLLGLGAVGYVTMNDPADDPVADSDPTPDPPPVEDPDPDVDPETDPEADPPPVADAPNEAMRTHLITTPEGAEVTAPDGALVGVTPVDILKPGDGEDPVAYSLHLDGYEDREFTISRYTADQVSLTLSEVRRGGRRRGGSTSSGDPNPTSMDTSMDTTPDPADETPEDVAPTGGDLHNPFAPGGAGSMMAQ